VTAASHLNRYGYPIESFYKICETLPDGSYIIADAGSTDRYVFYWHPNLSLVNLFVLLRSGPQKLCFNVTTCPRESYLRDFIPILRVAHERGFRILISSAGGHGSNFHVDNCVEIIDEICLKEGYSFKIAKIYSEIDKNLIKSKLSKGAITPCGPVPDLDEEEVRDRSRGSSCIF